MVRMRRDRVWDRPGSRLEDEVGEKGFQRVEVERFDEVMVEAGIHRADAVFISAVTRHGDEDQGFMLGAFA